MPTGYKKLTLLLQRVRNLIINKEKSIDFSKTWICYTLNVR
ncbi:hypothetical protein C7459_1013 [Tumebacillus permanentifrigoris]|uniref:Uncharacterized protein n=1 Tax=Tumebacillus permanentifrigoris TaxID=378543 RepID=A0A316DHQ5_9BACL|nr:hypothetical protein C7459_1013 [Tumebacillus permanentifrigoris]